MRAYQTVVQLSREGAGYSSVYWRSVPIIAALREMPEQVIYTDDEGAIYFLAGRYPYSLPSKWKAGSVDELRPQYSADLARMRERIRSGGLLVLFNASPRLPEYPPYAELTLGLREVTATGSGGIYAWPR